MYLCSGRKTCYVMCFMFSIAFGIFFVSKQKLKTVPTLLFCVLSSKIYMLNVDLYYCIVSINMRCHTCLEATSEKQ